MLAQLLQRATHTRLDALDRDPEQLRYFIVCEATRSVHLEHLALRLGECGDRLRDRKLDLARHRLGVRRRRFGRPAEVHLAALRRARLAQPIERTVSRRRV